MKVSIIIPVYNSERYLGECLDSVLNQTLKDIQIICVNDASTDHSEAILEEYEMCIRDSIGGSSSLKGSSVTEALKILFKLKKNESMVKHK